MYFYFFLFYYISSAITHEQMNKKQNNHRKNVNPIISRKKIGELACACVGNHVTTLDPLQVLRQLPRTFFF